MTTTLSAGRLAMILAKHEEKTVYLELEYGYGRVRVPVARVSLEDDVVVLKEASR
jgi:hypothetical protein